jgi:adenylate kinase family enzyme
MIVAIYGPSSVGKTTVASRVAAEFKLPLRSCGRVVRDRAKSLGIELKVLPDAVHQEIDQETVTWAMTHQPCLIEGRFLNLVLAGVDSSAIFIRLTASDIQRQLRACNSGRTGITIDDLQRTDAADLCFIKRMFPSPGVSVSCVWRVRTSRWRSARFGSERLSKASCRDALELIASLSSDGC